MAICLWVAIIVEAGVGHYEDVGILLGIQFFNAGLAFHEAVKAADAVAALKSSLKPRATAKRDGAWATLDATELVPGDLVKLIAGAAIPADVTVREGTVSVDASALTGESLPVTAGPGVDARMGSTTVRGEAEAVVAATGGYTFFGRTAALLNRGSSGPDNITKVITRITLCLSLLALVLCSIVLAYLLAKGGDVRSVLGFVVVLLVRVGGGKGGGGLF
jgi:H+-transporting ATPase